MSRRLRLNRRLFALPLMRPLGRLIHLERLARQHRSQSTVTKFFRNLMQLSSLKGPLSNLLEGGEKVRFLVAGCSYGCEAYSLGGYLRAEFPDLDWFIDAFDLSDEAVRIAQEATFTEAYGVTGDGNKDARRLSEVIFQRAGDRWKVAPAIRDRVRITQGDVINADFLNHQSYDIVLAQNFLVHMDSEMAAQAFQRMVTALKPGGALFAGGMQLDGKADLIRENALHALNWQLELIHNEDDIRRSAWPWHYWSLEPMDRGRPDFLARYSTIFLKGVR